MAIDWKTKSVLIVDDFGQMRMAIKSMIDSVSPAQVDNVGNGEDAMAAMLRSRYDLILCDYNLGRGKSGQQVLEEARHLELISADTVFLMITAEALMPRVLGVIENRPDDYLTKPFVRQVLLQRAERAMERKAQMRELNTAIRDKDLDRASEICRASLEQKQRHALDQLRRLAEVHVEFGNLAQAEPLYRQVLARRELPWARFGIAKVQFLNGQIDEACAGFQGLIADNQHFVEVYDWLARCQQARNENEAALETLRTGTKLSPDSLRRQRALGDLALTLDDRATAEKAYGSAVKLGRTSAFRAADEHLALARIWAAQGRAGEGLKLLRETRAMMKKNPLEEMRLTLGEAVMHQDAGHQSDAKRLLERATESYAEISGAVPAETALQLVETSLRLGQGDLAKQAATEVARNFFDQEDIRHKLHELYADDKDQGEIQALLTATREQVARENNQAVALFRGGDAEAARVAIESVAKQAPRSLEVNLNAARILMHLIDQGTPKATAYRFRIEEYLRQAQRIDAADARLKHLKVRYEGPPNTLAADRG
ncbi:MAG: response regulator [Chromatiales bacterium]|nr:response regulator [Chromatiales bacterium]